ncbi:MAG: efflux RND transporter periplasmic adaptor subunit [Kiritimatiellae bacterium]|nr:efflux RND transporter periplasmic adaptor subunit [Kiritimatiellia bacterium]MDD5521689.1 efflux RND transporter periplasmic adaptor subunit [Kiritimatiellia bacterium]
MIFRIIRKTEMEHSFAVRNIFRLSIAMVFMLITALEPLVTAEAKTTQEPATITTQNPPIARGRLYYSLKRSVFFPFHGIIEEIKAQNGQQVHGGDVLLRYKLTVEAVAQLSRRVHPDSIGNLKIELLDSSKTLNLFVDQKQELINLEVKNLASPKKLQQIEEEIKLTKLRYINADERFRREEKLLKDDLRLLKDLTGENIAFDNVPELISLIAPIDAFVIQVNSSIRKGAETVLDSPAFVLGVTDPMILRCQVHEQDAVNIALNDPAEFTLESVRDKKFNAKVSRISWLPMTDNMEQPSYYEIELIVPNPDAVLREGFHGQVFFKKARK